ncbi:MAG TPA: hypothetical protein VME43_32735 [Bryobacteraceae bacterium]|nr:hypothetical protein [Bryobacteraceae bacterium]
MSHPFEKIPAARRGAVLLGLGAAAAAVLGVLGSIYRTLPGGPQGMVALELAGTPEHLGRMLSAWDPDAAMRLAFTLGLNFLCLFALTNALALACIWAAGPGRGVLARAGILMAWGEWLAAVVWLVQNSLLADAVLHRGQGAVAIASALSEAKFALTGVGLLFAIAAGIRTAIVRATSPAASKSQSA